LFCCVGGHLFLLDGFIIAIFLSCIVYVYNFKYVFIFNKSSQASFLLLGFLNK